MAIHSGVTPSTLWAKNEERKTRFGSSWDGWILHRATNSQTYQTHPNPITKLNFCLLRWREKGWDELISLLVYIYLYVYIYIHYWSLWMLQQPLFTKYTKLNKHGNGNLPMYWLSRPMSGWARSLSASRRLAGMELFIGIWAMWGRTWQNG